MMKKIRQTKLATATESEALEEEKPVSKRLFLAVVALAVFVTVLTATMINVLISTMRVELAFALAVQPPTIGGGQGLAAPGLR